MHKDKAGSVYWSKFWERKLDRSTVDPRDKALNNHMNIRIHQEFLEIFDKYCGSAAGKELIEVGCGGSNWLPYFAVEHGLKVAGLDYSETGIQLSSEILARAGVRGALLRADLFNLDSGWMNRFDIVYSSGFVEHFTPTETAVEKLHDLCKGGGIVVTIIPNMSRVVGWLQKVTCKEVFDTHVVIGIKALRKAHELAGLEVESCDYLGTANFYVVNYLSRRSAWWFQPVRIILAVLTKSIWLLERIGMPEIKNAWTSPYLICVASRRAIQDRPSNA